MIPAPQNGSDGFPDGLVMIHNEDAALAFFPGIHLAPSSWFRFRYGWLER